MNFIRKNLPVSEERKIYFLVKVIVEKKTVEKWGKALKNGKFICGEKCGEQKRFSTEKIGKNGKKFFHISSSSFPQKNVEKTMREKDAETVKKYVCEVNEASQSSPSAEGE